MVLKNTQSSAGFKAVNKVLLIVLLFFSFNGFSQTITDVFPTRITNGSKMTVIGTGFLPFSPGDVSITGGVVIDAASIVVSDTEITFTVASNFNILSVDNLVLTVRSTAAADPISFVQPLNYEYAGPSSSSINQAITVDEVITNWDYDGRGYFRSNWNRISNPTDPLYDPMDANFNSNYDETMPNDRHELLAFTINGVTYSTGVNDAILDGITGLTYTAQTYQAYSTNGVSGTPNNNSYLLMADEIDGLTGGTDFPNAAINATVYDVLIDGGLNGQGLDLGTGISNFNKEADIRFFSGNGVFGSVNDGIPDLIITQIAQPGGFDIYYYTDINGNIVGRPVKLKMTRGFIQPEPDIYNWKLDLYLMDTGQPYQTSYPVGASFGPNESRGFRMVALELSDFRINATTPSSVNYIGKINNIVAQGGGSADMAFLAYNKGAFAIKSPKIEIVPLSQNICKIGESYTINFNSLASVDNPSSIANGDTQLDVDNEEIFYQWYKEFDPSGPTTPSYTPVSGISSASDLGTYRVRISNAFGAVDLPVTLSEGGTPTLWNGSSWELPPAYVAAGITTVADDERNLIFADDYIGTADLVGCDCRVLREKMVTIQAGNTLKLYDEINVEGDLTLLDDDGNPLPTITGGSITFEDGASLLQTKAVTNNVNSGQIKMERIADNLNPFDYIYWSSPVSGFDIANILGNNPYQWNTTALNSGNGVSPPSTGNWVSASGVMQPGRGYIKRVLSNSDFTTTFTGTPVIPGIPNNTGIPNNGVINVAVYKSIAPLPALPSDQNWNLVGNPYPSSINAETFLDNNADIDGWVNIWTRGTGIQNNSTTTDPFYADFGYIYGDEYITHNGLGPNIPGFDGKIASDQGFFVQVLPGAPSNPSVSFNNAMRHDSAENAYDNGQFFRSSNPEPNTATAAEKQLIWLGLVNESSTSSTTLVGYADGATNGLDRMYDAPRSGAGMSMYSVLEDEKMTIQGRAYPFDQNDTVALGVDLLEDGIYKITIDAVEGSVFEDETQGVYLEDTYLNVVHDLRATPYSFAGVAGTIKDRFVLRYTSDQVLSVAEQTKLDTFIYVKDERLYVKSATDMASIVIYDLTGKQIVTYKLDTNVSRAFNTAFQYPRGAYVAVINLDNNTVVGKKIIN